MSKIAHYLQEHLVGEVITSLSARKYFSTDGGVFEVMPSMIVYPQNENDVRKTAKFSWQLAERGRILPITARGRGSDQAGAAAFGRNGAAIRQQVDCPWSGRAPRGRP